jgi:peptidoglycan/LPS O-acetylase OafA/YrhL
MQPQLEGRTTEKGEMPGGVYYPLFDLVRIGLAVGVFAAHADRSHLLPANFGNACVQVFFALSGFLIGGILLKSTVASLPRFYFNRCTRIWIPYGIAIAILFIGAALRQNLHDPKLWEFFFYKVTFVYNLFGPEQLQAFGKRMPLEGTGNHFWSICVEEQFYLVAPLLIVGLRRFCVPILLSLAAFNFVHPHSWASISLGVLLAISRDRFGNWYEHPIGAVVLIVSIGAALAIGLVGWVNYFVIAPTISVAVVALLARRGRPLPMGIFLGGVSYPLYLDHWVGLFCRKQIGRSLHLGEFAASFVALVVAFSLTAIHYRKIDRMILLRRNRWYTPRRGILACGAGLLLVLIGILGGVVIHFWLPIR